MWTKGQLPDTETEVIKVNNFLKRSYPLPPPLAAHTRTHIHTKECDPHRAYYAANWNTKYVIQGPGLTRSNSRSVHRRQVVSYSTAAQRIEPSKPRGYRIFEGKETNNNNDDNTPSNRESKNKTSSRDSRALGTTSMGLLRRPIYLFVEAEKRERGGK